ncbi:MAG: hypothetical protein LBQ18_06135 [Campylobacteraceae bacterium]|jgi:hypothetical protein|nr:hypothetical protein [Campylobacteraceae bacterium]
MADEKNSKREMTFDEMNQEQKFRVFNGALWGGLYGVKKTRQRMAEEQDPNYEELQKAKKEAAKKKRGAVSSFFKAISTIIYLLLFAFFVIWFFRSFQAGVLL